MAHGIAHHDFHAPKDAIRDVHRERKLKTTLIIVGIVLGVLTFGGATAMMYSDAPEFLRSRTTQSQPAGEP